MSKEEIYVDEQFFTLCHNVFNGHLSAAEASESVYKWERVMKMKRRVTFPFSINIQPYLMITDCLNHAIKEDPDQLAPPQNLIRPLSCACHLTMLITIILEDSGNQL